MSIEWKVSVFKFGKFQRRNNDKMTTYN